VNTQSRPAIATQDIDRMEVSSVLVSNVLTAEKKQQAIALGRLGWSLRRIQKAIGVRRETISVYLKAAAIAMRSPRGQYIPAKPASREAPAGHHRGARTPRRLHAFAETGRTAISRTRGEAEAQVVLQ
jgi:hypothetical protein